MMQTRSLIIPDAIRSELTILARQGTSVEGMIAHMRASGLPKPVGMRLLADVKGIPLGEAKKLVHFSPVWADRKASDDAFHESLYESAEELGLLQPDGPLLRSGTHG